MRGCGCGCGCVGVGVCVCVCVRVRVRVRVWVLYRYIYTHTNTHTHTHTHTHRPPVLLALNLGGKVLGLRDECVHVCVGYAVPYWAQMSHIRRKFGTPGRVGLRVRRVCCPILGTNVPYKEKFWESGTSGSSCASGMPAAARPYLMDHG